MTGPAAGKKMESTLQTELASQLPEYLIKQRWFGGKARKIAWVDVVDTLPIPAGGATAYLFVAVVHYAEGSDETYAIPLVRAEGAGADGLKVSGPDGGTIMLADGLRNAAFLTALAELIEKGTSIAGESASVLASVPPEVKTTLRASAPTSAATCSRACSISRRAKRPSP